MGLGQIIVHPRRPPRPPAGGGRVSVRPSLPFGAAAVVLMSERGEVIYGERSSERTRTALARSVGRSVTANRGWPLHSLCRSFEIRTTMKKNERASTGPETGVAGRSPLATLVRVSLALTRKGLSSPPTSTFQHRTLLTCMSIFE